MTDSAQAGIRNATQNGVLIEHEKPVDGAWLATIVLTLTYTLAFVDRQLLNLLVEPVKQSLSLSDTQVSLLQGAAFSVAIVVFSPVFGFLSDRFNRRILLIGAALIWSLGTFFCGLATGFWILFLSRAVIGAAEACVHPASWSMMADYYPKPLLPRAMSLFLTSPYVGGGLALIFGGTLVASAGWVTEYIGYADIEPWRIVFLVIGAAGVATAFLLLLIREPARRGATRNASAEPPATPQQAMAYLWINRAFYAPFYTAMTCIVIVLYALPAWMPTVILRRFEIPIGKLGIEYGSIALLCGTFGVLFGPVLSGWLGKRGYPSTLLLIVVVAAALLTALSILLPIAPRYGSALALAGAMTFLFSLPQAMVASTLQLTVPPRMIGFVTATYIMIVSIIGLGIAPTIVALITDQIFGDPDQAGWSLGIVCFSSSLLATIFAWVARGHYQQLVATQRLA